MPRSLGERSIRFRTVSGIGHGEERKLVEEIKRVVGFDEMIGIDRPCRGACGDLSLSVSRTRNGSKDCSQRKERKQGWVVERQQRGCPLWNFFLAG